MPHDNDIFQHADSGDYTNEATGEVIEDPEFIMNWYVVPEGDEDIAEIKELGFIEPD